MKVLVTGGAGFIGSHVVEALIESGHEVSVVDNLSTGRKENLHPKATFYESDITGEELKDIFEKEMPDVVNHHAAQIDVRHSTKDPVFDAKQNIIGSINLFECARQFNVKKIIFSSTGGAIYGEQDYFPADEKHPLNPLSPYGIAKLSVEKYLFYYQHEYGIPYVILRYANVYGPRQNPKGEAGVIAIFADKMLNNEQAVINGDGKQTRDFVYVSDVARYNNSALQENIEGTFNIGTSIETDVNQIFDCIKKHANPEMDQVHAEAKPGEQERSVISHDFALQQFGFIPMTSLDDGISSTVGWFRNNLKKN